MISEQSLEAARGTHNEWKYVWQKIEKEKLSVVDINCWLLIAMRYEFVHVPCVRERNTLRLHLLSTHSLFSDSDKHTHMCAAYNSKLSQIIWTGETFWFGLFSSIERREKDLARSIKNMNINQVVWPSKCVYVYCICIDTFTHLAKVHICHWMNECGNGIQRNTSTSNDNRFKCKPKN